VGARKPKGVNRVMKIAYGYVDIELVNLNYNDYIINEL
jgi:hypothetical protein